jgi:hypothetical protein
MLHMPLNLPTQALREAETAISHAQRVRQRHARNTEKGSAQREADIKIALDKLRKAMRPLRSEIGRFAYGPQTETAEDNRAKIRAVSAMLQAERRKLWKMQDPAKRAARREKAAA